MVENILRNRELSPAYYEHARSTSGFSKFIQESWIRGGGGADARLGSRGEHGDFQRRQGGGVESAAVPRRRSIGGDCVGGGGQSAAHHGGLHDYARLARTEPELREYVA